MNVGWSPTWWLPCQIEVEQTRSENSAIPFLVSHHEVWLMPTAQVPCSNTANRRMQRLGRKVNFAPGKIPLGARARRWQTPCNVWLTSVKQRWCSNKAKMQSPVKFAGVPQTRQRMSAVSGPKFTVLLGQVEEVLLFNNFFPIVYTCLSCEDIARQSCAMVPRWRIFASCIFSQPRAAHFRPAF